MSSIHHPTGTPTLGAREFIARWGPGGPSFDLSERAGAQAHFIDLCRLLGVAEPGDAARYSFEKGVTRTGTDSQHTNGSAQNFHSAKAALILAGQRGVAVA